MTHPDRKWNPMADFPAKTEMDWRTSADNTTRGQPDDGVLQQQIQERMVHDMEYWPSIHGTSRGEAEAATAR